MQFDKFYDRLIHEGKVKFMKKLSPSYAAYRENIGKMVLPKQSRLYYSVEGFPIAKGSVTYIKYKKYCFAVTNEHCIREEDIEKYKIYVPSKEAIDEEKDKVIDLQLEFLGVDADNDLAAFLINEESLRDSKRNFIQLYPTSFATIKENTGVILIGAPGELLEYKYEDPEQFIGFESIKHNHITYFTIHEGFDEDLDLHTISVTPTQTKFGDGIEETKAFFNSLNGMSGSPAFIYNVYELTDREFNINSVKFLGITSNGDPQHQKAYVIDLKIVISFLDNIIETKLQS